MPYAVGISQDPDAGRAIGEAVGSVLDTLGPSPDAVAMFVSGFGSGTQTATQIGQFAHVVRESLKPKAFIGCTAAGVIGGYQEIEQGVAVSLWAAKVPDATGGTDTATGAGNTGATAGGTDTAAGAANTSAANTGTPAGATNTGTAAGATNTGTAAGATNTDTAAGATDGGTATAGTATAGTTFTSHHLPPFDLTRKEAADALTKIFGNTHTSPHTMILLADPHTFDLAAAIKYFGEQAPDMKIIGGLVSTPQPNVQLISNNTHSTGGAVALLISGDTEVVPLVSQGCKPIGQPLTITGSKKNIIESIGGKPPAHHIYALRKSLSEQDAKLVQNGLLIGQVVDEHRPQYGRGDFLIRNIIGIDRSSGAIAIAEEAPVGATVQFHVRDANTAHEDLLALLTTTGPAQGALLFTCNGRGSHMFDQPGHDASALADITQDAAVAGMFCAGEIGPIGGQTAIHGFTASAAIFRDTAHGDTTHSDTAHSDTASTS